MISGEKKQRYIKTIREFCLMDDVFLSAVFDEDIELTEMLLQVILENDKIKVKTSKAQYGIKNLEGHSAVLDIFAKGSDGQSFNVEVQRVNKGDLIQRARYYLGLIDSKIFKAGDDYKHLNDTYIIFITEQDALGYDLPIYHIKRIIAENGADVADGSHIIYVNAARQNKETALGRLMHDFFCRNAAEMLNHKLAVKVGYMKEKGGVSKMCELMQKLADKEAEERVHEEKVRIVERFLKAGATVDLIIAGTNLSRDEVEAIAKRIA